MTQGKTFVLSDTGTLSAIAGENDTNIREVERLLGVPVFVRGNEVIFDSDDRARGECFSTLVGAMKEAASEGRAVGPDFIRAVYESLCPETGPSYPESFREAFIEIPGGNGRIYPKSFNQAKYVSDMGTHDITFAVGPAGTGKTYLAIAFALMDVIRKKRRKLILTRPVVEAGENLGFLPGDMVQKINPYLRPLYDAMESILSYEALRKLEENRVIEIAPLAYMRGRSLSNCVIILDEAQNTTREQMKMFLTRMGEGSKTVITGDITQIDLPRKAQSGLVHALDVLQGIEEISFNRLDGHDVVRHHLIRKIIKAYDERE